MKTKILSIFLIFACLNTTYSQNREAVKTSTDILMFATPAAGFITTLLKKDYTGTKQLILSGATSVATSYLLKYTINKERPDKSDTHSFPSNHTAMAFQGASFIHIRYGWKYAIPAYLLSGYVAWGRIYAKRHYFWDVVAGAAVGVGSSLIFTTKFAKEHNVAFTPVTYIGGGVGVNFCMRF